ncbi:MAG: hypothetical protein IKR22_01275 [Clostridiales bacterium]|nr:hypothetical protein [Clostridiales bacterium]
MKRYRVRKGSIADWITKLMLVAGLICLFGAAGTDEMMEEMGTSMPLSELVIMVLLGMTLCTPWALLKLPYMQSYEE